MTEGTDKAKTGCKNFNYCFWAKLLVAIPAIPLLAVLAAAQFSHPLMQVLAAGAAAGLGVYFAVQIDRMPCFAGKVVKKKSE